MTLNTRSENWKSTIVKVGSSFQESINSLEKSGLQIVLVVSGDNLLIGTLTDGDIRRAFLKGHSLNSFIDPVVHHNPLVVPPDIGREMVLNLMRVNKIHQIPVVDRNGKLIGLHVWDNIVTPANIPNQMVIMAGGRGTRLHPHTENCPKPMLKVGNKPMLEHIIESAHSDGFNNFIISLHYLGEMIEDYFGDGSNWNVKIEYLHEKDPLGTAGCLSLLNTRPEVPFLVTNGDVLTDIHYSDILNFHITHNASATMAVRQYEIQNQFGVVKLKGIEIDGFEEKPIYRSHINAGIYVLSPEALNYLSNGESCDMPLLFDRMRQNGSMTIVFPMHEPWLDVGRPSDLQQANKNSLKNNLRNI
jgi:dTDP-glucose pyrophosphorylase